MKLITLDGTRMTTIQYAHEELARALHLPSYYGRNLDALWNFLSTTQEELDITLIHPTQMLNALDAYGASMLRVFFDASSENPRINFMLRDEAESA